MSDPARRAPGTAAGSPDARDAAASGYRILTSGALPTPERFPAVVLGWDNLLDASARDALYEHVARGPDAYRPSRVYSKAGTKAEDNAQRKSVVVNDDAWVRDRMMPELAEPLRVARTFFGFDAVPLGKTEMEVTASGDGDFFTLHCDDGDEEYFSRLLTFVFYLHRRPRPFTGGALRVYDSRRSEKGYERAETFVELEPADNRLVVFPSDRYHEVCRVDCPGNAFADRRFTVNGWLWADDMRAFLASQRRV